MTDAITIKKYPKLARFGEQAGKPNESFLSADLFVKAFLTPCEAVRDRIGLLMFEFSRFWPTDHEHGRDFIADFDWFLGRLAGRSSFGARRLQSLNCWSDRMDTSLTAASLVAAARVSTEGASLKHAALRAATA